MANISWETVRIKGENITPDLLIWRRYKRPADGMMELFEAMNPHVLQDLAVSPYLAVGSLVSVPVDSDILEGTPTRGTTITLYGTA
jgi:hypothetical protein